MITAGALPDPGQRLWRGPCWWTVPSLMWSCRTAWQTEHSPLALFTSWESGQVCGWAIEISLEWPQLNSKAECKQWSQYDVICQDDGAWPRLTNRNANSRENSKIWRASILYINTYADVHRSYRLSVIVKEPRSQAETTQNVSWLRSFERQH